MAHIRRLADKYIIPYSIGGVYTFAAAFSINMTTTFLKRTNDGKIVVDKFGTRHWKLWTTDCTIKSLWYGAAWPLSVAAFYVDMFRTRRHDPDVGYRQFDKHIYVYYSFSDAVLNK